MNELQIFKNEEFGEVRTVTIDNEPWFVGKDVAMALGFKNTRQALSTNVMDEDKGVHSVDTPSGTQQMTIINESGLYALIFGSRLESAKRFKHWVTSDVLPAIRKTGGYQMKRLTPEEIMRIQLGMLDDHDARITNLENNMTLDYGQQKSLGDLVSQRVIHWLGGKNSNAYHQCSKKVFAECNRDIKNHFNVNARNNIPKLRYEEAVEFVKSWEPCEDTKMMIYGYNSQMNLNLH